MLLRRYHNVQQQEVKKQVVEKQPAEKPVEVVTDEKSAEKPPVKRGRRKKVDIDECFD